MAHFSTKEEYKRWIEGQDWYQTIELKEGLMTPGKVPTHLRTPLFEGIDFAGKSFLDVGCSSGQYCFLAKERGATKVVGFDTSRRRIEQARILAENEDSDVTFEERSLLDTDSLGQFDIVFCLAVLTEIQDVFGAIEKLKNLIGELALIEVNLAKPIFYASYSRDWLKGYRGLSRQRALAEVRQINNGQWVFSPSLDVLRAAFGEKFRLMRKPGGVRYDLVEVVRLSQ